MRFKSLEEFSDKLKHKKALENLCGFDIVKNFLFQIVQ